MRALIFTIILLNVFACQRQKKSYTIVKAMEIGGLVMEDQPIVDLLSSQKGIDFILKYSYNQDSVIGLVENHKVDFAIVPNSLFLEYSSNLTTITSLLPRVLLIIYNGDLPTPESIKELVVGRRIGFQTPSNHDLELIKSVLAYYDIDADQDFTHVPVGDNLDSFEDIDLFISLTHLHNNIVEHLIDIGGKVFSLDDPMLEGEGSSVDGFLLTTPKAYSFTLPKLTYTFQPEEPILTIAVRDIMISNAEIDEEVAYAIIQTISESRASLTHKNQSYGLLDPTYNSLNTAFAAPLHKGSVRYLHRNEPSFFERNARLIGIVISLIILLNAALPRVFIALQNRKKQHADKYYKQVLELHQAYKKGNLDMVEAEKELAKIRELAFEHLAKDRLATDDSFTIFLTLLDQVKTDINPK